METMANQETEALNNSTEPANPLLLDDQYFLALISQFGQNEVGDSTDISVNLGKVSPKKMETKTPDSPKVTYQVKTPVRKVILSSRPPLPPSSSKSNIPNAKSSIEDFESAQLTSLNQVESDLNQKEQAISNEQDLLMSDMKALKLSNESNPQSASENIKSKESEKAQSETIVKSTPEHRMNKYKEMMAGRKKASSLSSNNTRLKISAPVKDSFVHVSGASSVLSGAADIVPADELSVRSQLPPRSQNASEIRDIPPRPSSSLSISSQMSAGLKRRASMASIAISGLAHKMGSSLKRTFSRRETKKKSDLETIREGLPPTGLNASHASIASSTGSGNSNQQRQAWLPRRKGNQSTDEEKAVRREKYEQMIAKYQQGPDRNVKLAVWSEKETEAASTHSSSGASWVQKRLNEMSDLLPFEDRQDVLRHFLDKAEGDHVLAVSLYMQAKKNNDI